ncbi:Uma2 family endonuclease [Thiothrix subterranea]|uniref:Uma2 family endonuclease n=1 Tax=Thiothrix subterranea TaxID=2735563 RepID=A0AA51MKM0_9GAMM|nr:Uma2 family endonuclease [Thiothrix subterranea]MDQ5768927.1 Uma2 family endonuclease [Thiothrix subterranea]WML86157.1 Uma2 family endonuclease [Thiothrix subterranea]
MSLAYQLDTQQRYTYQDYLRWPDDVRYELLGGEPVVMSAPSTMHQRVIRELVTQLTIALRGKSCEVFPAPFDVCLAADDAADDQINNVVQPDISVICDGNKIHDKGCKGAPDWIIEVLSPSTASRDLIHKLRLYERYGVREYWVVHPIDRVVMMWQLSADSGRYGAVLIEETQGMQASGLFPDLVLEWDVLFPPPKPLVYVKEPPPGDYYS